MTDTGAGADGRKPARPRGGPFGSGIAARLTGNRTIGAALGAIAAVPHRLRARLAADRLALAVAVGVLALALVAAGVVLGRQFGGPAQAPVSAPADRLAGTAVAGGSPLPGSGEVRAADAARNPALVAGEADAAAAVAVHIPRLNVDRNLVGLRVQADRKLSVPKRYEDVGWWTAGPQPGAAGAALLAGHVSSKAGPGVFFELRSMRRGDLVTVDRADGTSAVFQVVGKASFPRSNFPDEVVYRVTGKPSIHLVTCDGPFDSRIGHHQDNLVVFADLVSSGPTKEVAP